MKRKNRRIMNRSGKMPCEICGECTLLEQHHIKGRKIDNPHHPSNIANICPNCHTKVHANIIIIEKRVMTTSGYILIWH